MREDLKFHSQVVEHIAKKNGNLGVYKTVLAHSGAIIGTNATGSSAQSPGEVPSSVPNIRQQVRRFNGSDGDARRVDLVLIDGGINDVSVGEIVSPIASSDLDALCRQRIHDRLVPLLSEVTSKFPNARIVVCGYYPIVSKESDITQLFLLLAGLGLLVGGLVGAIIGAMVSQEQKDDMVRRSKVFARSANQQMTLAVDSVNQANGNQNIVFVDPGFTAKESVFAPASLLWGIGADFSPEDKMEGGGVASAREEACDLADLSTIDEIQCDRASLGHPNIEGQKRYAEKIVAVL